MALSAQGITVREYPVGEADRFADILTGEFGIVHAAARGARRMKSRSGTATRLLCWSEFSLIEAKEKYIVESARPKRVFFSLGGDLQRLSLAQYFCELFNRLAPRDEPAWEYLLLLLRALHLLEAGENREKIKAAVELRLCCLCGYRPDLSRCACGEEGVFLNPRRGGLMCARCAKGEGVALSPGGIAALRFIADAPDKRCFSFRLSEQGYAELSRATEAFLMYRLPKIPNTLTFYNQIAEDNR